MSEEEKNKIIQILNYCEEKFSVNEWKYEGVHVWPLVRIELGNYLIKKNRGVIVEKRNYFMHFKIILIGLINYVFYYFKNFNKVENEFGGILFIGTGNSYVKLLDKWYDSFSDPIIDILKLNSLPFTKIDYSHNYLSPKKYPAIYSQFGIDFIIIKTLLFKKKKISKIDVSWYEEFRNYCLENNFHFRLLDDNSLKVQIFLIFILKKKFIKLFSIIRPKFAFITNYYSMIGFSYLLALKEIGIKVGDIQHGVQHKEHYAYSSWSNLPVNGFEFLPNYFFNWSDSENVLINNWASKCNNHKSITIGNIFIENWLNNNNSICNIYDKIVNSKLDSNKKTVLYTCSLFSIEKQFNYLPTVISQLQNNFNLIVRVHPQDLNQLNEYKSYLNEYNLNENINIEWGSTFPLYSLLRNIDFHITLNSTVIIEAERFEKQTIMLDLNAVELYQRQIKNKSCYSLENVHEIQKKIHALVKLQKQDLIKESVIQISILDFILREVQMQNL